MSDAEWDLVQLVHVKGAFACTKAAWPHFRSQKFGRIINTASAAGLYGNVGQANYSAAKMGLIGFTKTLAQEGAKYNIRATAIAPMAASAMTETIMPPEMLQGLKPEFVAPFVAVLTHPDGPDASGRVFEVGAGFAAEIRWERSKGAVFRTDETFTPSVFKQRWDEIIDFENAVHPNGYGKSDILVSWQILMNVSGLMTTLLYRAYWKQRRKPNQTRNLRILCGLMVKRLLLPVQEQDSVGHMCICSRSSEPMWLSTT